MELPNRRQRRRWAKATGLLDKKKHLSFEKQMEINRRTAETGKQIHFLNVERNLQMEQKKQEEKERKIKEKKLEDLITEGHTTEEAMSILSKKDSNDGTLDS